jgi:hypothetical protein
MITDFQGNVSSLFGPLGSPSPVRSLSAQRRRIGSCANTSLKALGSRSSRTSLRKSRYSRLLGETSERAYLTLIANAHSNIGLHEVILRPGSRPHLEIPDLNLSVVTWTMVPMTVVKGGI